MGDDNPLVGECEIAHAWKYTLPKETFHFKKLGETVKNVYPNKA